MKRSRRGSNRRSFVAKASSHGKFEQIPLEWLDARAWQLPSGKALVDFALHAGAMAPFLLGSGVLSRNPIAGKRRGES
jgi:hypothetical protein